MNDITEKLWPAFLAEAGEQIEALELSLVGTAVAAIDVNSVFRNMHTIKGGCAMMGFGAMEAVAHAAEDLLDGVRRGQRTLDDGIVDALLTAVDALKAQLAEATATRRDPAPLAALVERLRTLAAGPAAAPTPPATGRARGKAATAKQAMPAPPPAGTAPATAPAPAPAPAPGDDAGFAGLARARLPTGFATWLKADPDPQELRLLAAAASEDALPAVATLLQRIPATPPGPARRLLLADLLGRLQHIEDDGHADCGSRGIAAAMREALAGDSQLAIELLSGELHALAPGMPATAALEAAEQALALLQLQQLPVSSRLLRFIVQVLRDAARDRIVLDDHLVELLRVGAGLPAELAGGQEEDAPYLAMGEQVLESLRAAAQDAGSGDPLQRTLKQLREQLSLRQETLDTLTPDAVELLRDAVARQRAIVEIEADLEATPDGGAEFVAWLSAAGTIISNHTVFHRESSGVGEVESTRLRFLAALNGALDDARRALGELDPQRRWFTLHACSVATNTPAAPAAMPPAEAADGSTPRPAAHGGGQAASTLRIDSATLDQFVNRVGEMVMLRNMLSHALHDDDLTLRLRRQRHQLGSQVAVTGSTGDAALRDLLADVEARLEQLAQADLRLQGALGRLQEDVIGLRVVPIGLVFNRLPRTVRDLSHAQHKQVELEISGEDVRIDKGMVDVLLEPLMHMVRNSIDHGIESPAERTAAGKPAGATLSLAARQQGNTLLIEIADDGRGLDLARIRRKAVANGLLSATDAENLGDRELANLIFLPGFSTAEQVTAVSGRGVGMDIVKTRIMQVGGQIEVQSTPGRGARFTLRMPLSAAIQNVVLVGAGSRQFALPERNVTEVVSIARDQLQHVQGQAACLLRGVTLPVYHLDALMGGREPDAAAGANLEIVVLSDGVFRIGLLVERVIGRPEVFVRDMHPDLAKLPGVGGVSILGDGRVVVILDCENLFDLATRNAQSLRSLLRAS